VFLGDVKLDGEFENCKCFKKGESEAMATHINDTISAIKYDINSIFNKLDTNQNGFLEADEL
jgi:hypothetical protein